jgi:hypothetical protein
MPAPLVARKPTGALVGEARVAGDDHGWRITAREATHELEPGLAALAAALAPKLAAVLDDDAHTRGLSRDLIAGNRYLPDVALPAASLSAPLIAVVGVALSRTQDDKGRVRWTLLGDRPRPAPFWAGFHPARARPTSSTARRRRRRAGGADRRRVPPERAAARRRPRPAGRRRSRPAGLGRRAHPAVPPVAARR